MADLDRLRVGVGGSTFGQPHEFLGSFSGIPPARPGSVRAPGASGTAAGWGNTKRAGGIRRHVHVPHTARFSTGC